jgi:hypothetical protein
VPVVWSGVEVCTPTKGMKETVAERCSASMGTLSGKSVEGVGWLSSSQKKKKEVAVVSY